MKKLTVAELKEFRDRLYLPIPDAALEAELPPYYHPGENSDEIEYMRERRAALGGYLPKRVVRAKPLTLPGEKVYDELKQGSGKQAVATTMAFVRLLKDLMKDQNIGKSQLLASVSPACVAYDPAWAYEVSVIVADGLRRMYGESPEHPHGEDIFYYLTVYNEPYQQPKMPADSPEARAELEEAILRGLYRYAAASGEPDGEHPRAQILGSGVAVRWALEAQRLLAEDWGVAADG